MQKSSTTIDVSDV